LNYKCLKNFFIFLLLFLLLLPSIVLASDDTTTNFSIESPAGILIESKTGKVLFEKNSNEKMYPASLTKVLTAIIILENCDLNEIATVSYDAVMSVSSGYVTANLQVGEELTVEQLLNVMLIGSSNDSANVLAEHVSGSIEDFAILMNNKAKEIGCTNSNFLNPSGAHEENHYSTAGDLALITKYAMENDTFREIVKKTSYKLPATNKYPNEDRLFTTTNELIIVNNNNRADNYYYQYAIGVKTGFTTPAMNCLIAASSKDNLELITVILGAVQNNDGLSNKYLETIKMFKYGYSNYAIKKVVNSGDILQSINVAHATKNTKKLDIVAESDVSALVKIENINDQLLSTVTLNDEIKAPIKKGDIVGKVSYSVEGITYETNLLANSDVKKSKSILHIFEIFVVLLILYLLSVYRKKMKKNRRIKVSYFKS